MRCLRLFILLLFWTVLKTSMIANICIAFDYIFRLLITYYNCHNYWRALRNLLTVTCTNYCSFFILSGGRLPDIGYLMRCKGY